MFIVPAPWKAEWVGGLTLETHPASETPRCRAAEPNDTKLNSVVNITKVERLLEGDGGFTCVGVLLLLPFSPLLLAL